MVPQWITRADMHQHLGEAANQLTEPGSLSFTVVQRVVSQRVLKATGHILCKVQSSRRSRRNKERLNIASFLYSNNSRSGGSETEPNPHSSPPSPRVTPGWTTQPVKFQFLRLNNTPWVWFAKVPVWHDSTKGAGAIGHIDTGWSDEISRALRD